MLDKDAIKELKQSAQIPSIQSVGGIDYLIIPDAMTATKHSPCQPAELKINTLGGMVEYLKNSNLENELWKTLGDDAKYLIHIQNYHSVRVISPLEPTHMTRRCYVQATARPNEFNLSNYMTTERFIISVMSSFMATAPRDNLLSFVSQMKAKNTREELDSGVAQTVTVQKTVATLALAEAPNPVELQPYVTFPEITQPLRTYIFRIKQQKPEDPILCGLFPIESSVWEAVVCDNIRNYCVDACKEFGLQAVIIS